MDLPRLVEIDRESQEDPWSSDDFDLCLKCPRADGVVVEVDGKVVGYMMYLVSKERFFIVSMAVSPKARRAGCGKKLLGYLFRRVRAQVEPLRTVESVVSDRLTQAHFFFRSCGFRATEVVSHHFGPDHDGYRFVWTEAW